MLAAPLPTLTAPVVPESKVIALVVVDRRPSVVAPVIVVAPVTVPETTPRPLNEVLLIVAPLKVVAAIVAPLKLVLLMVAPLKVVAVRVAPLTVPAVTLPLPCTAKISEPLYWSSRTLSVAVATCLLIKTAGLAEL